MNVQERAAMLDGLLEVLRPVLTARGTIEVGDGPLVPLVAARLLDEAALRLAEVRSMLPAVDGGGS